MLLIIGIIIDLVVGVSNLFSAIANFPDPVSMLSMFTSGMCLGLATMMFVQWLIPRLIK